MNNKEIFACILISSSIVSCHKKYDRSQNSLEENNKKEIVQEKYENIELNTISADPSFQIIDFKIEGVYSEKCDNSNSKWIIGQGAYKKDSTLSVYQNNPSCTLMVKSILAKDKSLKEYHASDLNIVLQEHFNSNDTIVLKQNDDSNYDLNGLRLNLNIDNKNYTDKPLINAFIFNNKYNEVVKINHLNYENKELNVLFDNFNYFLINDYTNYFDGKIIFNIKNNKVPVEYNVFYSHYKNEEYLIREFNNSKIEYIQNFQNNKFEIPSNMILQKGIIPLKWPETMGQNEIYDVTYNMLNKTHIVIKFHDGTFAYFKFNSNFIKISSKKVL